AAFLDCSSRRSRGGRRATSFPDEPTRAGNISIARWRKAAPTSRKAAAASAAKSLRWWSGARGRSAPSWTRVSGSCSRRRNGSPPRWRLESKPTIRKRENPSPRGSPLEGWLTLFVALTGLAVLLQAGVLLGIYLLWRKHTDQMAATMAEVR